MQEQWLLLPSPHFFSELVLSPPLTKFLTHIVSQHFLILSLLLYYSILDYMYVCTLHLPFCRRYTLYPTTSDVTTISHILAQ